MRRPMTPDPVRAYVGFGANLGDPLAALDYAVQAIDALPDTHIAARSACYQAPRSAYRTRNPTTPTPSLLSTPPSTRKPCSMPCSPSKPPEAALAKRHSRRVPSTSTYYCTAMRPSPRRRSPCRTPVCTNASSSSSHWPKSPPISSFRASGRSRHCWRKQAGSRSCELICRHDGLPRICARVSADHLQKSLQ